MKTGKTDYVALLLLSLLLVNSLEQPSAPFPIRIVLVGLNGDGAYEYKLEAQKLQNILEKGYGYHVPLCYETKLPVNVTFDVQYEVIHEDRILPEYERILAKSNNRNDLNDFLYVDTTKLETLFRGNSQVNSIYIINPDKTRMAIKKPYLFRPCTSNYGSQIWIGPEKYVVIDLSAGPVTFGPGSGEGMVTKHSLPDISKYFVGANAKGRRSITRSEVEGHISALIINAIKYVFVPDIRFAHMQQEQGVFVALIVLKDHNNSVSDPTSPYYINIPVIERELKKMLPISGQYFEVVMHEEVLHNHKQLSMAVQKSLRWESLQDLTSNGHYKPGRRPFLDSQRIFHYLSEIKSDPFARSLLRLSKENYEVPELPFDMRMLPVYIFSLFQQDPRLTLEDGTMVEETQKAIVVLQTNITNITIPFMYGTEYILMNGRDTTRHIVAGLISVIGGIVDPWVSSQTTNNKIDYDYRWALGYHPFGHLMTKCTLISGIFHETIIRNQVISSVNYALFKLNQTEHILAKMAQAYLYTESDPGESDFMAALPFWVDLLYTKAVLPQIKEELEIVQVVISDFTSDIQRVTELLQNYEFDEAYQISDYLRETAKNLYTDIENELISIEDALICCYVRHKLVNPSLSHRYIIMGLISVCIFLCVRCVLLPRRSVIISQRMRGTRHNQGAYPKRFL